MAGPSCGSSLGGGVSVDRLEMPAELQAFLEALPGEPRTPRGRAWQPWEDEFIRQAKKRGALIEDIAAKLGVCRETLRKHCKQAGL